MSKKVTSLLDEDNDLITALESGAKVKRVNIRMTMRDVEKAQAVALREGIPYATLLTNILHYYFTGRLKLV